MPSEYHFRGAKRAREARAALGLGQDGPLADTISIIEELTDVHVVVLELPEDIAGAYVNRPGMPLLVVCGTDHPARQRFTLAHEFGHFRMGHEGAVDRQATMTGYVHDPCEVEANSFAAEFLVPKQAIVAWGEARRAPATVSLEDVVALAWDYGVSAQMMRYRLVTCGVLRDQQQCDRLDGEIAEGLHLELADRLGLDFLDDSLARAATRLPRIPRGLRNTLFGDLLAGEIDVGAFADRLDRDVEEVQGMLASLGLDQLLPAAAERAELAPSAE